MNKAILVRVKNVYGNRLIYPVCDQAKIFAGIAGMKTLNPETIKYIKDLGYTVNVETPKL